MTVSIQKFWIIVLVSNRIKYRSTGNYSIRNFEYSHSTSGHEAFDVVILALFADVWKTDSGENVRKKRSVTPSNKKTMYHRDGDRCAALDCLKPKSNKVSWVSTCFWVYQICVGALWRRKYAKYTFSLRMTQPKFWTLVLFFVISTYKNYQNHYRRMHFLSSNFTKIRFHSARVLPFTPLGELTTLPQTSYNALL